MQQRSTEKTVGRQAVRNEKSGNCALLPVLLSGVEEVYAQKNKNLSMSGHPWSSSTMLNDKGM
jgi:hypothetical protein